MLAALPEQTHHLRAKQNTAHVWPDHSLSSGEESEPEAQHVLFPPNDTVLLGRIGDDMWLGGIQLTQHGTDSKLGKLCRLAAAGMMSPSMP